METALDERIARIIARRQRAAAMLDKAPSNPERERRLAHERVLGELPRFLTKLSSVVLELNDRISDVHIGVKFKAVEHTPAAEAIYVLSVSPSKNGDPQLVLSIDFSGKINALLHVREARTLIKASTVFTIDHADIMDLLLSLLEAQHD